jgi:hypothetical protein
MPQALHALTNGELSQNQNYLLYACFFKNAFNFPGYILSAGALRYKPEGFGFDSHCCHWNFSLT